VRSVTWYPPQSDEVYVFGTDPGMDFMLMSIEGTENTLGNPDTTQGPGQRGTTLRRVVVNERVIQMRLFIGGDNMPVDDYQRLRQRIARAMVAPVRRPGKPIEQGTLVFDRGDAFDTVRIDGVSRNSPKFPQEFYNWAYADLEFVCPQPWYSLLLNEMHTLGAVSGFTFPMSFPVSFPSYDIAFDLNNVGDVPVPFLARIYGDLDAPSIINDTLGQRMDFTGNVPSGGYYLEIQTGYGQKRVELVSPTGTRTKAMDRVVVNTTTYWELLPGINHIRFETAANTGGIVLFTWTPMVAGL
jgi:hypothetical protein